MEWRKGNVHLWFVKLVIKKVSKHILKYQRFLGVVLPDV